MIKIDLHDYYPCQPKGSFIDVSDDVAVALIEFERVDVARQVKEFRYQAYYSLDAMDGIEEAVLKKPEMPQEIFERKFTEALLSEAISRLEGKHHSSIADSIKQALSSIEKYFVKN